MKAHCVTRTVRIAFCTMAACGSLWGGYVQDGLVLHYDAIDNAGVGVHSENPTEWVDLSGNGSDLALPSSGVTVGTDSITFAKVSASVSGVRDLGASNLTNFTLEVVARTDESFTPSASSRYFVYNNRIALLLRQIKYNKGLIGFCHFNPQYNAVYSKAVNPRCADWNNLPFIRNFHTYSVRVTASGGTIAIDSDLYQNPGSDIDGGQGSKSLNDILQIGSTACNFIYKSIRLYNRHLTEAEMRQNRREDALRFPPTADTDANRTTNVFSDALYLFRGARTGSDEPFHGTNSVPNALWAGTAEQPPADFGTILGPTSNIVVETMDVPCPYARKTLKDCHVLRFRQCAWEQSPGVTNASATIYRQAVNGNFTNMAPYSVVLRFMVDSALSSSSAIDLLYLGYGYSNECGLWLRLVGPETNMYVQAWHGSNADTFAGMTNRPMYRIERGKWIDLALTVSGDSLQNRLYYRTEDGELYEATASANIVKNKDSRQYVLSFGGESGTTGKAASSLSNFRGWYQQVAVWGRELSREEVMQALRDGCDEYDAVRVGIPNGGNCEFAGTGTVCGNDGRDWLGLTNALSAAGAGVKVLFDLPAGSVSMDREFRFAATPFFQSEATLRIQLNGLSIAEALNVQAGKTAVAAIPASYFRQDGNELEIVRTDGGNKTVEIDYIAVTSANAVQATSGEGSPDVYSEAYAWHSGVTDGDGDGLLFPRSKQIYKNGNSEVSVSSEFRDVLHCAIPGSAVHQWQKPSAMPASNYVVDVQNVVCPAAGRTLQGEPCLRFASPSYVNGSGNTVCTWGGLSQRAFAATNTTGYSVLLRVKLDGYIDQATQNAGIFGFGLNWTGKTGSQLSFMGAADNMSIRLTAGRTNLDFTETQSGAEANRLSSGKWIDIGYTASNGYFRVYTCTEGGTLVEHAMKSGGSGADGIPTATTSPVFIGALTSNAVIDSTSSLNGFRGSFHQLVLWPRTLTRDEMVMAMTWPKPDIFHLGVRNGLSHEFSGGSSTVTDAFLFHKASPSVITSGDTYTVEFDVDASDAAQSQLLSLAATPLSVGEAAFAVTLNGDDIANYDRVQSRVVTELVVASGSAAEIGIHHRHLRAGRNVLVLTRMDGNVGAFVMDAMSLGNGGRSVHVVERGGFSISFR